MGFHNVKTRETQWSCLANLAISRVQSYDLELFDLVRKGHPWRSRHCQSMLLNIQFLYWPYALLITCMSRGVRYNCQVFLFPVYGTSEYNEAQLVQPNIRVVYSISMPGM
jgi:hypothetical protein